MSTIPSWAVKGAKVVCVKEATRIITSDPNAPSWKPAAKGEVYTISKVAFSPDGGHLCLLLVGFNQRHYHWIGRFRPVSKRTQEQDIAKHFSHHMHQPVRETERAQ